MTLREDQDLRVPPHSREAEQSVLGGLLLDNSAWDRAGELLADSDFYCWDHRHIYAAIGSLINDARPADVITVFEQLQSHGKGEECGGLVYLNALAASVPSAANLRRYAEIVRQHADARAVIAAAASVAEVAWGSGTPREKLDKAAGLLAALDQRTVGNEPARIGQLVADRLEHYAALEAGEAIPGIATGLPALDRALGGGLKPGKLVVLGARPTVGKTSLSAQIGAHVANTGTVLLCSQEMTSGELVDRFVASAGGVALGALTAGTFAADDWAAMTAAAQRLEACGLFIDDTPALSLAQVRAKARAVRRQHGLALIIVDYLQLMSGAGGSGERRHHQIESISRGLKQLAKELGICILLLSQLNRASLDRPDSEPELSDLKESGAIEEDADVVLLLHPMGNEPDGTLLMLLKLAKNRQGRRGRLALRFDGRHQIWHESAGNVDRRGGKGHG